MVDTAVDTGTFSRLLNHEAGMTSTEIDLCTICCNERLAVFSINIENLKLTQRIDLVLTIS